jgi:hypothetical protein
MDNGTKRFCLEQAIKLEITMINNGRISKEGDFEKRYNAMLSFFEVESRKPYEKRARETK